MADRVSVALSAIVAGLVVVTLTAQAPKGWLVRIDHSSNASDPDASGSVRFTASGSGFHAVDPQAAVFWNPANTATGAYSLKGTFTLLKPSGHTNYYGLVFGGTDLASARQSYLYFLVAQDGSWLIKRRDGDTSTQDVVPRAVNAAVKKPDAKGQSVNALEVRVEAGKIDYFVNGTLVHTTPRTGLTAKTDGIYGVRVNHLLDVQIDGLALSKP